MDVAEERAWNLATREAKAVYASPSFMLGSASLLVMVGALFAYVSWGDEPGRIALGSIATGLGANLICFASVLAFHVLAAPYRQRDELRRALRAGERISNGEIAARASGFSRQGEDLLQTLKAGGGYTREQEKEVEEWTTRVSDFLAPLEGRWAIEFSQASRKAGAMATKLERRIEALDALVEALAGRPSADSRQPTALNP